MKRVLLALLASGLALTASAQTATLVDKKKLAGLTANPGGYQLVDARSEAQRRARKLPLSSPYAPDLKPSASLLIVIADDDISALRLARALAKATAKRTVALKGGMDSWSSLAKQSVPAVSPATDVDTDSWAQLTKRPSTSHTFVIPRNTCESGSTLQEYKK